MVLSFKTKLFSLLQDSVRPEFLSPFFCQASDTYTELRMCLEEGSCVDWPFDFWNFEDQFHIRRRFEAMNVVTKWIYVILAVEEDVGRP